jgi:hypothetical protein
VVGGSGDLQARQRAARAANEVLARDLPEVDAVLDLMCECGRIRCPSWLHIAPAAYERVRNTPGQWLVLRAHVDLELEKIVELVPGEVAVVELRHVDA